MAIKHHLALDIPDTSCETILRIMDASVYADELAVDCPRLDIYLPGFDFPIYYTNNTTIDPPSTLNPGFVKVLSSADLGLTSEDNPLSTFPDGIYKIRYSVSPNETVYVEYYHLRVTRLMNAYNKEICKVMLEPCEPTAVQHQKMHDLNYIKMYITAAKAKAEYCHSPKQAIEMYTYAERLLSTYLTGKCLTCKK